MINNTGSSLATTDWLFFATIMLSAAFLGNYWQKFRKSSAFNNRLLRKLAHVEKFEEGPEQRTDRRTMDVHEDPSTEPTCKLPTEVEFPKKSNHLEYILMGRALTLPLFVITTVSSWYGNIFGITQIAYREGMFVFLTQGIFWYAAYILFAFTLAEKINRSRIMTIPERIKETYGPLAGKYAAVILFFKSLPITHAISISLLLENILGIQQKQAVAYSSLLVIAHCQRGALRSVVISEIVQFITMFVAVLTVIMFSYWQYGGFDYLYKNLPSSYFTLQGSRSTQEMLAWLFIAIASTIASPIFYQRCLAASSPQTARRGILISIICWMLFDCCTTLGGVYAKASMPNLPAADAYLIYALNTLPVGFKGIFIAGVACAVLSTLDAKTIISSNTLTYDLWRSNSSSARMISVVIVTVITSLIAVIAKGNIEIVWLKMKSYFIVLIFIPILWGYFGQHKGSERQFICSFCISLLAMLACDLFITKDITMSLYIGSVINAFILAIFSLARYKSR